MTKNNEKISAKIKTKCEDFIVEEKAKDWQCTISKKNNFNNNPDLTNLNLEEKRDFLVCELEKKDIDFFRTRKELASMIHKGVDSIGFAGIKDKKAHTCQRISIFEPNIELIKNFKHPNIYLKNFKWSKRKIKIGYLEGNKFTITLRDIDKKNATKTTNKIKKTNSFPNYFGKQRFGSLRENNAKIGYLIIKKQFKEAINIILTETNKNERQETTLARQKLEKEKDYKKALEYFPIYLKFERRILEYLSKNKEDYIGAIRMCERKNFLMYLNALQSKLFNEILEVALQERIDFKKKGQQRIPLFGYKSRIDNDKLGEIEQDILQENNINLTDFRIDELKYLSLKGDYRMALVEVNNMNIEIKEDEIYKDTKKIILSFNLPSGVYATTFLENFFDLIEERN